MSMDAVPVLASGVPGVEEQPVKAREWRCQHCGTLIDRTVLASFNGAPLCLGGDRNCYKLVSFYDHQMPCLVDPCPGEVYLEHEH